MKKLILLFFMFLLVATFVQSATLHGNVYDLYLNEQGNVRVEINTEPKQIYVSKDGDYSFEVVEGEYVLTATYSENGILLYQVEENVSVVDDGDFVVDLILFPVFDDDDPVVVAPVENDNSLYALLALVIVIVLISVLIWYAYGKFKKLTDLEPIVQEQVQDDLTNKVLDFIKKHDGRITQKEIRKEFLSSEAKISLVLTELEQKGIVEKIKKGRGNIIVLK